MGAMIIVRRYVDNGYEYEQLTLNEPAKLDFKGSPLPGENLTYMLRHRRENWEKILLFLAKHSDEDDVPANELAKKLAPEVPATWFDGLYLSMQKKCLAKLLDQPVNCGMEFSVYDE